MDNNEVVSSNYLLFNDNNNFIEIPKLLFQSMKVKAEGVLCLTIIIIMSIKDTQSVSLKVLDLFPAIEAK